ncbi:MAG: hypothetical protein MUC65_00720 [Pontiellaceae bacterium]|jgi:hypothetical protein|nr:hypothetical protein [Pontiellaceae bacterium]
MKFDVRYLTCVAGILLLCGCGQPVAPLPPDSFVARAVLSTDTITVGGPATLTLTARHPAGSTVFFPDIGNGKKVVVRGRSSDTRQIAEGILESEELYQLTSFRVGDWIVATNPVACTFSNGTGKQQALPELILHVQSSLGPDNATLLSDIKPIVKPPLQLSRTAWIILLIAALALLAGIVTLLYLRKPRAVPQTAPPLPPHVIAGQALAALRTKEWIPEPFFTELSFILRTYLEDRFELHAPESTTEELTRAMTSDKRLEIKEQQTLRNFMTQADLVKFARADAAQEVMQTAFTTVEQFVEQTKQEEHLPQESTENSKRKDT